MLISVIFVVRSRDKTEDKAITQTNMMQNRRFTVLIVTAGRFSYKSRIGQIKSRREKNAAAFGFRMLV
jgi:hypothetical protein